ncbi:MAG TPA: hypothetical protein VIM73_07660 [Polyangiaceae bacterium]
MSEAKKPIKRRDATGHLDPDYARELLEKARETRNNDGDASSAHAFIPRPRTGEELAEELGEAFVESATSGGETEPDRHERFVSAEAGGPYVPSSASEEFASGTDESNIPEAEREPLPRTSKAKP